MRGINHLVLVGRDLEAMRAFYAGLGFTITPRGRHPFGTDNHVIQLHGGYLELLAIARPADIPEATPERFSFAAFNRDYVARHEGFSMLVLDSTDAARDLTNWRAAGLRIYEPFGFSRPAALADGREIQIGFSLAHVSDDRAPWLGLFACQHHAPEYYAQPRYLEHANQALSIAEVWIAGEGAQALGCYLATVAGLRARVQEDRTVFTTRTGDIVLAGSGAYEQAFGVPPPHPEDGPHLAGYTVAVTASDFLDRLGLERDGESHVVRPSEAFGTAIRFRGIGR